MKVVLLAQEPNLRLVGLKLLVFLITMSSNPFTDPLNLDGQSFPHALSPFSASESAVGADEFVESLSVGVFVGEDGVVNIADKMVLWGEGEDVLDCKVEPKFSKENKFVKGLENVLPGVPVGAAVVWSRLLTAPPAGWGEADGSIYRSDDGRVFEVPVIPDLFGGGGIGWIVRLPAGAIKIGGGGESVNIGN